MKNVISPLTHPEADQNIGELLLTDFLDSRIQKIGISGNLAAALEKAHVCTIRELIVRTERELLYWPRFGRARIEKIKRCLSAFGFRLGMDEAALRSHPVMTRFVPKLPVDDNLCRADRMGTVIQGNFRSARKPVGKVRRARFGLARTRRKQEISAVL